MRNTLFVACLFLLLASPLASGQQSGQAVPVPAPEHKRLGYFVGTWLGEAQIHPNPFMPAGSYSAKEVCEWFEGGYAVVCLSEGRGPMGPTKSLMIFGYSTEEKTYVAYSVDNSPMIMTVVSKGTLAGDTWTYIDESKMGGAPVKSRFTIREASPTTHVYKWEVLGKDGKWQLIMEGSSKKQS